MWHMPADFWLGLYIILTSFDVGTGFYQALCLAFFVYHALGGTLDWLCEKLGIEDEGP